MSRTRRRGGMVTRREWLRTTAGAGAAFALGGFAGCRPETGGAAAVSATATQAMILKAIPSSGQQIPVIGLGGRWISANASAEELADHRAVLRVLAEGAEGAGR